MTISGAREEVAARVSADGATASESGSRRFSTPNVRRSNSLRTWRNRKVWRPRESGGMKSETSC